MNAQSTTDLLMALATSPRTGPLLVLMIAAAIIDMRTMRIPNWLTVGGMLTGLTVNALSPLPAQGGVLLAFAGLVAGLFTLLPLYALRMLGAGDVKMMAAVGAFLGFYDFFPALLFVLVTAGIAAICVALRRGLLANMAHNALELVFGAFISATAGFRPRAALATALVGRMPYGVCILVGTTSWMVFKQLGHA